MENGAEVVGNVLVERSMLGHLQHLLLNLCVGVAWVFAFQTGGSPKGNEVHISQEVRFPLLLNSRLKIKTDEPRVPVFFRSNRMG